MSSWKVENVVWSPSHHHCHNSTIAETGTGFYDWGAYTSTITKHQLILRADVDTYIHKE